ncbi:DUF3592 domain-containing protein [Schumannella sp. 10F1B-5-1]|uniref:DUF3592 domain-containing protein n=1 Tax=Schumannella sp. 10F1B-5-1 TaxID=2590780 RepID=UPI0015E83878|nr:DUF3592 domain-containing protein [Schumannella sp. 10F1B-5-1]
MNDRVSVWHRATAPRRQRSGVAALVIALVIVALVVGIGITSRVITQNRADEIIAQGQVVVGDAVECPRGAGRYGRSRCFIVWSYEVDGTTYTFKDRLKRYARFLGQQVVDRGQRAEIYYDPADPSQAALGRFVD